jgi:hypothetical protein
MTSATIDETTMSTGLYAYSPFVHTVVSVQSLTKVKYGNERQEEIPIVEHR